MRGWKETGASEPPHRRGGALGWVSRTWWDEQSFDLEIMRWSGNVLEIRTRALTAFPWRSSG